MYTFTDTIEQPRGAERPAEALSIDGVWVEDVVPGYRTLYVSGRELLAQEITLKEVGARNGALFQRRRYPERVITVGYQLIAATNAAFRSAFNQLCRLLDVEEARLIFADEPDKFFIGTPSGVGDVDPGRNAVTGEIEFTCADPFKYSVKEYEAAPASGGTVTIAYNGTMPGFPVLCASFDNAAAGGSSDGCGYVAFVNDRGKIIQLGDPEEADGEDFPQSQTLVNQSFKASGAWDTAAKSAWPRNTGTASSTTVTQTGDVAQAQHNETESTYYLHASDYGSGEKWHGPSITRTLPADAAGESGAKNFTLTYVNKVSIGKASADVNQLGGLQMLLLDASGGIVAGVSVLKSKPGTDAVIRFRANGKRLEDVAIDLSYYNQYFGSNNTSKGTKTVKTVKVTKTAGQIEFNAGGVVRTYSSDEIADTAVVKVQFMFLSYGSKAALTHCGLYSVKLVKHGCTAWKNVPNKFSVGDELSADCGSGEILLNGLSAPDLGALGNDWEEFGLLPGQNQIVTAYSDWVPASQAPTFSVRYREVFL